MPLCQSFTFSVICLVVTTAISPPEARQEVDSRAGVVSPECQDQISSDRISDDLPIRLLVRVYDGRRMELSMKAKSALQPEALLAEVAARIRTQLGVGKHAPVLVQLADSSQSLESVPVRELLPGMIYNVVVEPDTQQREFSVLVATGDGKRTVVVVSAVVPINGTGHIVVRRSLLAAAIRSRLSVAESARVLIKDPEREDDERAFEDTRPLSFDASTDKLEAFLVQEGPNDFVPFVTATMHAERSDAVGAPPWFYRYGLNPEGEQRVPLELPQHVRDQAPSYTESVQQAIWRNQHPPDCSTARYLLWETYTSGMGSSLNIMTVGLAHALATGRVFLYANNIPWLWTSSDYCGDDPSPDCYFAPVSNCTLADAGPAELRTCNASAPARVISFFRRDRSCPMDVVPPPFTFYGRRWGVSWWRANALVYMMQPNARLSGHLAALRARFLQDFALTAFPRGAISAFVRRTDKKLEMDLFPLAEYVAAAERLRARHDEFGTLHVSTDDAEIIDAAASLAPRWRVLHTREQRFVGLSVHQRSLVHGASEEALTALLNLFLDLECGAFVGTQMSNWGRVIQSMRSILAPDTYYVRLNHEDTWDE